VKNIHGNWIIPSSELRPLILEWGQRNGYETGKSDPYEVEPTRKMTLQQVLAHRSGVPVRRIAGILNGNEGFFNARFDTADSLLCAMNMADEWHGRLATYYDEPIEVAAYEMRRLLRVAA
jgi:hypothetical protein